VKNERITFIVEPSHILYSILKVQEIIKDEYLGYTKYELYFYNSMGRAPFPYCLRGSSVKKVVLKIILSIIKPLPGPRCIGAGSPLNK